MFFNRIIFRCTNVVKISLEVNYSQCVCVCLSSLSPSLYTHMHRLNYFRSLSHYETYPGSDGELYDRLDRWLNGECFSFPSLLPFKWRKNNTCSHIYPRASLVAQLVKHLPAMREAWVRSLGWEDALEKGKATHTRILAWRILYVDYTVHGVTESWT